MYKTEKNRVSFIAGTYQLYEEFSLEQGLTLDQARIGYRIGIFCLVQKRFAQAKPASSPGLDGRIFPPSPSGDVTLDILPRTSGNEAAAEHVFVKDQSLRVPAAHPPHPPKNYEVTPRGLCRNWYNPRDCNKHNKEGARSTCGDFPMGGCRLNDIRLRGQRISILKVKLFLVISGL